MEEKRNNKRIVMITNAIRVEEKHINRTEYVVEVPIISPEELKNFFDSVQSTMGEVDKWILREESSLCVTQSSTGFKVCFRSPTDFDLSRKIFYRVWDFNSALIGETLSPLQVLCLLWAICKLEENHILFMGCGSIFHVISNIFEVGKYRGCFLDIDMNATIMKPRLCIRHHSSPVYFNPTSYYCVLAC